MSSHRKSLSNVFPGVVVPRADRPGPSPESFPKGLADTLKNSIRRLGFPAWGTLHRPGQDQSIAAQPANFTLTLSPEVRSYKSGQPPPLVEFDEAASLIKEIQSVLSYSQTEDPAVDGYAAMLEEEMATLIFSSNANEHAGLDHEETRRICRRVFAGEKVEAADVDIRSPAYKNNLAYIKRIHELKDPGVEHVIRSRREIIQHAQALHYITDAALNHDGPLTEDVIKDTHKILCEGVNLGKEFTGDVARSYAGVYRTMEVMAGSIRFCLPADIPTHMKILVSDFNKDVFDREDTGQLDPFYLAADICQDFVMIHPFLDGNGRMCRLLLNAYLLKYAGVVMNIGEHDAERDEYMAIVREAGDDDEEVARGKLGRLVLERGTITLRKLKTKLNL